MDEKEINEEPIKNRKGLSVLFNIFITFLSLIALAIAGVLIYQKRYLTPFWVNGQSMYPTLNKYAVDSNGNPLGINGGSSSVGCRSIDYGVMDTHERALRKIKRFDVVVCKYASSDASDKIKRVVALPGETLKFGQGSDNGTLYIKGEETYTVVTQPLDNEYVVSGSYPTGEITLGDNEYYVLGDNRAHSSDSRSNGPIKFEWLIGKVVCVCAHCELRLNADGGLEPFNIDHFIPRFL